MQITHTATLGYQEITITQTLENDVMYSAKLEHTRVAAWPTAGLYPEVIEGLDSFLETIEIAPFSLAHRFAGALRTDLSRSINSARLAIRDSIYANIDEHWLRYRIAATNRERASRYSSAARPTVARFVDGNSDRFVQLVLDYFRANESVLDCPDSIEGCRVIHLDSIQHEIAAIEEF